VASHIASIIIFYYIELYVPLQNTLKNMNKPIYSLKEPSFFLPPC